MRKRIECMSLAITVTIATAVPVGTTWGGDGSAVVRAWIQAWQRRDTAAWQALFAPEGTYEDSLTRGPVLGAHHPGPWANLWPAARAWTFTPKRIFPLTDAMAVEWQASLHLEELELAFAGLAILEERDGHILWMRNYFDTRPFLRLLSPRDPGGKKP